MTSMQQLGHYDWDEHAVVRHYGWNVHAVARALYIG